MCTIFHFGYVLNLNFKQTNKRSGSCRDLMMKFLRFIEVAVFLGKDIDC